MVLIFMRIIMIHEKMIAIFRHNKRASSLNHYDRATYFLLKIAGEIPRLYLHSVEKE